METGTLIRVNYSSPCLLLCFSLVPSALFTFVSSAVLIFQNKSWGIKEPSLVPAGDSMMGLWRAACVSRDGGPRRGPLPAALCLNQLPVCSLYFP